MSRWAVWLLCAGCLEEGVPEEQLDLPDYQVFRDGGANDVLLAGCTVTNGGCHTSPDRPLQVVGVPGARLDPNDVGPITDEELEANYRSAAVFAAGLYDADDSWLLRKPLPPAEGGLYHVGDDVRGVVFDSRSDRAYAVLKQWIKTAEGVQ